MLGEPCGVDLLRPLVRVGAVEQHNAFGVGAVGQNAQQIRLRAARFGENDRLLRRAELLRLGEGDAERLQQGLTLAVLVNGSGKLRKPGQIGDLGFDRLAVGGR